jgi:tRNA threonylcarbamoyladenosine biosynthesis protein TsaB
VIALGIDTSGYVNAVGVTDGERVLAEDTFTAKTDSLEQIVDNIDAVLKRAGLTLKDVGGTGVGLGPGSWTGIRVGVTVGKMLAFSAGKPVCGVSTLEALAFSVRGESDLICAVVSAGIKDAVYAGLYHSAEGMLSQQGEYYVGDVKGLGALLNKNYLLVGDGAETYAVVIGQCKGIKMKAVNATPNGAAVAALAARRFEKGESDDALSLTPLYLKESTAKAFTNKYSSNK